MPVVRILKIPILSDDPNSHRRGEAELEALLDQLFRIEACVVAGNNLIYTLVKEI